MSHNFWLFAGVAVAFCCPTLGRAQSIPQSDPQALSLARQSVQAITAGAPISDVVLDGQATWAGTPGEMGNATVEALGSSESRIDLSLSSGTRTEIRDGQTGTPQGKWANPDGTSDMIASANCWTDPVWFFPALSSLAGGQNVVLSYVGQEIRNGEIVQHIQSSIYDPYWPSGVTPSPQQLSVMDFYLDSTTLLPSAVIFKVHPDNAANTNLPVEVDFANYQKMNGIVVPTRIARYQQGVLIFDLTVSTASFNTGLQLSTFAISQ